MGAIARVNEDTGGGEIFRVSVGVWQAVLAECVYLGMDSYQGGKEYPKALCIFQVPGELIPEDAKLSAGEPKEVIWWIRNFAFNGPLDRKGEKVESKWLTDYEKHLANWLKAVPRDVQPHFMMGRDLGTGPDDWDPSLTGDKLIAQRADRPGVPVGTNVMLRVEHHTNKSGKTYAVPAPSSLPDPPSPVTPEYVELVKNWVPGLTRCRAKEKFSVSENFVNWNERKRDGDKPVASVAGQSDGIPQEEDDDEIPF